MAVSARKYNPGFLTDDELVASFCVRRAEFDLLVEILRTCTGSSNPHQIVIGPQGSGKTSLLLRVAAEVRRDAALAARCFPVIFAEESYEVATAGEFWLECLTHLTAQASCPEDDPDLNRTVTELRAIRDDQTLADRCLAAVLDFADRRDKRLLLVVENLNALFRDMTDPDAGWRLRKVLQTEPRVIMFASATSRFDEIDHPDHALYDLFGVHTLRPLDTSQCAVLWESVVGRSPAPGTVRSLEILTGGNSRLISIVARFGAGLSFRELMADLLDLVDDHTGDFKSHIESLPAQERRVYLALATLWKPATTRETAEQARLDTSTCSAQLARLGERGAVQVAGGSARRKQYYLTARLYNIYYLLRRRRPDHLVAALIRFMESYYSPSELREIGARMVQEMDGLDAEAQLLYQAAFTQLMELPAVAENPDRPDSHRDEQSYGRTDISPEQAARELFETTATLRMSRGTDDTLVACGEVVRRFGTSEDPAVQEWVAKALVNKGVLLREANEIEAALDAYDEVVRRFGFSQSPVVLEPVAKALVYKTSALGNLGRPKDALAVCDEVVRRFGGSDAPELRESVAKALINKGVALDELDRPEEALAVYDEAWRRFGMTETLAGLALVAHILVYRGTTLAKLNRLEEAVAAWDEVVRRFGESEPDVLRILVADALVNKAVALGKLERLENALAACEEVVQRFEASEMPILRERVAKALVGKGVALGRLNRLEEALAVNDEVVHRFGESESPVLAESVARALTNKGVALGALNRPEEALAVCEEVVRRCDGKESPELRVLKARALLTRAEVELGRQQYDATVNAVDQAFDQFGAGSAENRWLCHLIRAKAYFAKGDMQETEQDIEAILAILPELGALRREHLDALAMFSDVLGPARMLELIKVSPSATLLLPLTTALERELGFEPRVAREVEEVAEDIRQDLAKRRARRPRTEGQEENLDKYDVQEAITKLREVVPGRPEVYQKTDFSCCRTRKDGSMQNVTVTILDAGINSPANLRYHVHAEADDGATATGNPENSIESALSNVHWGDLDRRGA